MTLSLSVSLIPVAWSVPQKYKDVNILSKCLLNADGLISLQKKVELWLIDDVIYPSDVVRSNHKKCKIGFWFPVKLIRSHLIIKNRIIYHRWYHKPMSLDEPKKCKILNHIFRFPVKRILSHLSMTKLNYESYMMS